MNNLRVAISTGTSIDPVNQAISFSKHPNMAVLETPGKMYALAAVLSILAIVAVILRFYARRLLKSSRVEIDDYMILPALVCYITFSG